MGSSLDCCLGTLKGICHGYCPKRELRQLFFTGNKIPFWYRGVCLGPERYRVPELLCCAQQGAVWVRTLMETFYIFLGGLPSGVM